MKNITHADFALRMQQAADGNPIIPPKNYGQLGWFTHQFEERFQVEITQETIRKWFAGESRPRHKTLIMLAELLKVSDTWLAFGKSNDIPEKTRRLLGSMANGVVNLVGGMIQICGGTLAFPDKTGPVDLSAVIKGALYQFHIVLGARKGADVQFNVSVEATETLVIGVIRTSELSFDFYELEWDKITEIGGRQGSHWIVSVDVDILDTTWKKIHTFADRL